MDRFECWILFSDVHKGRSRILGFYSLLLSYSLSWGVFPETSIVRIFGSFWRLNFILRLTLKQIKDFRILFLVTLIFSLIKINTIIEDIWIFVTIGLCSQMYIKDFRILFLVTFIFPFMRCIASILRIFGFFWKLNFILRLTLKQSRILGFYSSSLLFSL